MFDSLVSAYVSGKMYEIIFGIIAIIMLYGLSSVFLSKIALMFLRLIVFCIKFPVLLTYRLIKYCCGRHKCKVCKKFSNDVFKATCCGELFHENCISKIIDTVPKCPSCNMHSDPKFYEIAVYSQFNKIASRSTDRKKS
jgi:hypothetical protein